METGWEAMSPVMERSNLLTKKLLLPTERRWSVRVRRSAREKEEGGVKGSNAMGSVESTKECCGMSV